MDLNGKVAVITGASGGIGEEIARTLDAAGAKLVLTARSPEKLDKLASSLRDAVGVPGEITEPALPAKLIDTAVERFGRCDVFVNNAGVMRVGTVDEVDVEELCAMVRTNFESVVRSSYLAARHFKAQGSGYLVNMSSIAGVRTNPTIGAYCGSKAGIEALTDCLWMELSGTGVGVAVIEPGTVDTPLYATWTPEQRAMVGKGLEASSIARMVRFVLEQPDDVRVARLLVIPSDQKGS